MAPSTGTNRKINYTSIATSEGPASKTTFGRRRVGLNPRSLRFRSEEMGQEGQSRASPKTCWSQVKHRVKEFVPLILLVAYSSLGGVVFWQIEGSYARQTENSVVVKNEFLKNETAFNICKSFDQYLGAVLLDTNITVDAYEPKPTVMNLLQIYARSLGLPSEDVTEWTFWGSVFYSATVCTSIGYGNMAPKTRLGQAITMVYAVLGIPLVLYTLSIIGKYFCLFIWHTYVFVHQLSFGFQRKKKPTDITDFPLWLAVLSTLGWILACSGIFCILEPWDFFKSFYFFFQSLTTIGFGDITPDEPTDMIFCFVFIIIGMGLVGMCWNLMQIKMEKFVEQMAAKIRERYLQSELNDSNMDEDVDDDGGSTEVEKQIDKIASQENAWLTRLMHRNQKNTLALEWRRRAKLRNKFTQTEIEMTDQEVSTVSDFQDGSAQTATLGSYYSPFRQLQQVPYREIKGKKYGHFGTSNDDFKNLLHEISHIITDCRNTISRDSSLSSCSNLDDISKSVSQPK